MPREASLKVRAVVERLHDDKTVAKGRVLWRAKLFIPGGGKDEFLFRGEEEFTLAAASAQQILESRASCKMVSAQIVAVERVARLWN